MSVNKVRCPECRRVVRTERVSGYCWRCVRKRGWRCPICRGESMHVGFCRDCREGYAAFVEVYAGECTTPCLTVEEMEVRIALYQSLAAQGLPLTH